MKSKEISRKTKMIVYRAAIQTVVICGAKAMILTKGEEEKPRRFERKTHCSKRTSRRSPPRTDEFISPGKVARRGHCESHNDTEAAMVRPHEADGR